MTHVQAPPYGFTLIELLVALSVRERRTDRY